MNELQSRIGNYRRKRSCGKVMFSQVSVCPWLRGGYVSSDDHQVSLAGSEYVQAGGYSRSHFVPTPGTDT